MNDSINNYENINNSIDHNSEEDFSDENSQQSKNIDFNPNNIPSPKINDDSDDESDEKNGNISSRIIRNSSERFSLISDNNKYKYEQKDNIRIWLDKDLYLRDGTEECSKFNSKDYLILQSLFSLMNFEDYLALHCTPEIVEDWQSICESNNHFVTPMHASQYEMLFNKFISKSWL